MAARKRVWSAGALALAFTVLYGLALTRHVTEDAIKYVKDSLAGGEALFHPHHLLYHGMMALVVDVAGAGPAAIERSIGLMQWANVFLSVAAVLVFFGFCLRVGASLPRALLFALLFGLSSAFFEFSSQVEVYNVTALCSCLVLYGMANPDESRLRRVLVGSGFFFAMGFHQVGIFLGIAIFIGEALRQPRQERGTRLLATLVVPLVAIGACYGVVGLLQGMRSLRTLWDWITLYGHMPYWGLGRVDAETLRDLIVGVGRALVDVSQLENWVIVPAVLGLGVFLVLQGRRFRATGQRGVLLLACAAWLFVYGIFMAWWDAGNVESWIIAWVPLFGIVAIVGTADLAPGPKRVAWSGLVLCLALMASADWAYMRHDRRPNWARAGALELGEVARSGDLVFAVDTDKGAYYELYLLGRGVRIEPINLDLAREATVSDQGSAFTAILVGKMRDLVQGVRAEGGRCFVDAWVVRGEISPIRHMRDIDREEFRKRMAKSFALRPLHPIAQPLLFEITSLLAPEALP